MLRKKKKTEKEAKHLKEAQPLRTAQGSLPWKAVLGSGVIQTDKDSYTLICRFENAPYLSQTENEQQGIYERYISMLNGLSPQIRYQELIFNTPVNRARIDRLMVPDEGKTDFLRDYKATQKRFADEIAVDITEKEYYIALSYTATSKLDNPFSALTKAAAAIGTKLQAIGSGLTQLSAEQALEVLYRLYNPFSPATFKMPSGRVSIRDLIAPGDIDFKANCIRLGDALTKVFVVWGLGGTLDDTFVTDLLNNACRVTVSKHIEHVPKDKAIEQMQKRLRTLEADRQTRLKKNKQSGESYVPLKLETNIENCREIIGRLSGDEDLYRVAVIIGVSAKDEAELREACSLIVNKAAEHYVVIKPLSLQQEEAFDSLLPLGKSRIKANTLMLSSEVGVMTPFSYPVYLDENGIYYGKNLSSGEPIVIDRRRDKNSNGFIFGKSGSGKSFYAKLEIAALLAMPWFANDDIIAVDPDGEFIGLAHENPEESEVIRIASNSDTVINPFTLSDYELNAYGDGAINNRVHYILAFLSALKGQELTAIEKTVADRAVTACYRSYIADGKAEMPTLVSFDAELEAMPEDEAHKLRLYIERYIKGSIKLFCGQTNIQTTKKLTVFDLTLLGGELKNTGMLALLTLIWDKVYDNYAKGRWTWLYFDELHRYYRDDNGLAAEQIERLYAEIRKFGGIVTSMTQHPKGVLASASASSMLANSQFVVLFEQDAENVDAMAERLKLNEQQKRRLVAGDRGEAVLRARNSTVALQLKFPSGNRVYDTITTDFKDRIAAGEV